MAHRGEGGGVNSAEPRSIQGDKRYREFFRQYTSSTYTYMHMPGLRTVRENGGGRDLRPGGGDTFPIQEYGVPISHPHSRFIRSHWLLSN